MKSKALAQSAIILGLAAFAVGCAKDTPKEEAHHHKHAAYAYKDANDVVHLMDDEGNEILKRPNVDEFAISSNRLAYTDKENKLRVIDTDAKETAGIEQTGAISQLRITKHLVSFVENGKIKVYNIGNCGKCGATEVALEGVSEIAPDYDITNNFVGFLKDDAFHLFSINGQEIKLPLPTKAGSNLIAAAYKISDKFVAFKQKGTDTVHVYKVENDQATPLFSKDVSKGQNNFKASDDLFLFRDGAGKLIVTGENGAEIELMDSYAKVKLSGSFVAATGTDGVTHLFDCKDLTKNEVFQTSDAYDKLFVSKRGFIGLKSPGNATLFVNGKRDLDTPEVKLVR